jgi:hypothetical protein
MPFFAVVAILVSGCAIPPVWLGSKIYVSIFRKEHVSVYLVAELVAVVAKVHAS